MERILMIGATGKLGQPVLRALVTAGHSVRVLVRDRARAAALPVDLVERIALQQGDLADSASLKAAAHGMSAVYLNLPTSTNPRDAFIPERDGVANVLRVLPREILILKLSEIAVGEQATYHDLALKTEAEARIRSTGNPYILFRPTWFMESLPLLLTRQDRVFVFGRQRHPLYWIAARDYATQVVAALQQRDQAQNRTFAVQGPEALTFAEAAQRYVRAVGGGLGLSRMPLALLRLAGLIDAEQREIYRLMAHYTQRRESFMSADTWALLGQPTTTIEAFAAEWRSAHGDQRLGQRQIGRADDQRSERLAASEAQRHGG